MALIDWQLWLSANQDINSNTASIDIKELKGGDALMRPLTLCVDVSKPFTSGNLKIEVQQSYDPLFSKYTTIAEKTVPFEHLQKNGDIFRVSWPEGLRKQYVNTVSYLRYYFSGATGGAVNAYATNSSEINNLYYDY